MKTLTLLLLLSGLSAHAETLAIGPCDYSLGRTIVQYFYLDSGRNLVERRDLAQAVFLADLRDRLNQRGLSIDFAEAPEKTQRPFVKTVLTINASKMSGFFSSYFQGGWSTGIYGENRDIAGSFEAKESSGLANAGSEKLIENIVKIAKKRGCTTAR